MRVAQDRTTVNQTILLDSVLRRRLLEASRATRKTLSQIVREALLNYLKKRGRPRSD